MKNMKMRFLQAAVFAAAFFGNGIFAGAAKQVQVGSLKGPTSMGLVAFMEDEERDDDPDFAFTMVTAADELAAKFTGGDIDIALIPANLASVLYQKTQGGIQVIDINTLGVLSLVSADSTVQEIADLKGKTVYSTGKGTTPEYVLNYLLESAGLTDKDVTVEYKTEATEVVSALTQDAAAIGVLPQPFVTAACMKNENLRVVADLTQEWEKTGNGTLVTGVTVAKKEFIEANPEAIEDFIDDHEDSAEFVVEKPARAAELIASYGIVEQAEIAEQALPGCNIVCITGAKMQTSLEGYLQALFEQNPESVGGALPEEDFYYVSYDD